MNQFIVLVLAVLFALASSLPVERAVNDADCGVAKVSSRIVGGQNAYKGQFPWQISLVYLGLYHICGATIIDDKWVMCAAHCFSTTNARYYTVKAGAHNIGSFESQAVSHSVKKIYKHKSYNPTFIRNDIALLELDKPLNFQSNYINRVCLPETEDFNVDNEAAIISGWGDLKNVTGSNLPSIMQWGETTITDEATCENAWTYLYDHKYQVCAHSKTTATCVGDSGGPITVDRNGQAVQVGIVSFGSSGGCLHEKYPSVFTRVTGYLDWIKTQMGTK